MKAFGIIIVCVALTGCALNRPSMLERTTTTSTNGSIVVTERRMKVTTAALWPAQSEVSKQRSSLGKTMSTGASSIDMDGTGGTNGVEALRTIDSILGKIRP